MTRLVDVNRVMDVEVYSYLKSEISPLHSEIRTYVLIDRPREFIVQLPRHNRHQNRPQSDYARNRDKV